MRFLLVCGLWLAACAPDPVSGPDLGASVGRRVIVFVWDGLRPDSISAADTPNLARLRSTGVDFTDHHATWPTFTMMNAASFATGSYPEATGFYGNRLYQPGPTGNQATGQPSDFVDPIFTEDYAVLESLDAYYEHQLLRVGTLFQAAQAHGYKTAAVGKAGPAFLQDRQKGGLILDEHTLFPLELALEMKLSAALPATAPLAYPTGTLALGAGNGQPTAFTPKVTLADRTSSDPTDRSGSPVADANAYLMDAYLRFVLPKNPELTVLWLRAPDSPQHTYGPGSPNYRAALRHQDQLLGQLEAALRERGLDEVTDLLVVSDHGHSSVSGPQALFPKRPIYAGQVIRDAVDPDGWSVSGDVRIADLLTRAGIPHVFDGQPCLYVPVMSGIKRDGTSVYPTQVDTTGAACGKRGARYTTRSFAIDPKVPLPPKSVVVSTNGGSDYLYLPDHDAATLAQVVRVLQSREEVGAIFVHSRYGHLPGTLALTDVKLESPRAPDLVFSYTWSERESVAGMPGTEHESMTAQSSRGMHGSFSPRDVHNTLIAVGPDFRRGFADPLPSGNVDVAPTVAKLLGLPLPAAEGRPLDEALADGGAAPADYAVERSTLRPVEPATALRMQLPTDPNGADVDAGKSSYSIDLQRVRLSRGERAWTYFDWAAAVRK